MFSIEGVVRYDFSFAGDPTKKNISNLQLWPIAGSYFAEFRQHGACANDRHHLPFTARDITGSVGAMMRSPPPTAHCWLICRISTA